MLGFLGPKGTFSYEIAKKYLKIETNKEIKLKEYATITDIIIGLKKDEIDEAIVPVENSIQGCVTETIDSLIETQDIFITKELVLKISHNLMANKKYKLNEIKEIYSHPQAIAQCRKYIEKNMKNVVINTVSSTAIIAKEIVFKDNCACIASLACIDEYNLVLIDSNIQDNDLNETKFWVLNKTKNNSGKMMSIIFSLKNEIGTLYNILKIFNDNNINLIRIESRPTKNKLGEYIFLIDIEINNNIENVMELMKKKCLSIRILGIY